MEDVICNVADISSTDRRALEHLIGRRLGEHQQLVISILNPDLAESELPSIPRPAQTLDDWARVYNGLSDEEIEAIDAVAKTRANLTRKLP